MDGLRHINNCNIPMWFEQGREGIFRFFNPDMSLESWNLIMANMRVEFTAQMRLGHEVEIRTWVKAIGRSSVTCHQEAWQRGERGAWGESVIVHFDFAANASLPISGEIRAQLEQHLLPPGASLSSRRKVR